MVLGNAIRITDKNLKNSYWAKNQNGYQILNPAIENNINLYCKVHNNKITAAVEVFECPVTRDEKILARTGNWLTVCKHFMIG